MRRVQHHTISQFVLEYHKSSQRMWQDKTLERGLHTLHPITSKYHICITFLKTYFICTHNAVKHQPWLSSFSTWFFNIRHCFLMLLVSCSRTVSQDNSHIFSLFNSPLSSSWSDSTCRSRNKKLQTISPLQTRGFVYINMPIDSIYWRDGKALLKGNIFPSREIWLSGSSVPWQHNAEEASDQAVPRTHHRDSGSASKTHSFSHLQARQVQTAEFCCQTSAAAAPVWGKVIHSRRIFTPYKEVDGENLVLFYTAMAVNCSIKTSCVKKYLKSGHTQKPPGMQNPILCIAI